MKLLSALVHDGTEYFSENEKKHAVNVDGITEIDELPEDFLIALYNELQQDVKAKKALDRRGVVELSKRIEQYFECNYSKFSGNADFKTCGGLGEREVVSCANRLNCLDQGHLCRLPNGLTKKEALVCIYIAMGMMDAEICYVLKITQSTLRNHKNNIEVKIGQTGKIAIGVWTYAIGLIYIKE